MITEKDLHTCKYQSGSHKEWDDYIDESYIDFKENVELDNYWSVGNMVAHGWGVFWHIMIGWLLMCLGFLLGAIAVMNIYIELQFRFLIIKVTHSFFKLTLY